jgi:hypothetical protein
MIAQYASKAILRFVDGSGVTNTHIYFYIVQVQDDINVLIQLLRSNQRKHPTLLQSL